MWLGHSCPSHFLRSFCSESGDRSSRLSERVLGVVIPLVIPAHARIHFDSEWLKLSLLPLSLSTKKAISLERSPALAGLTRSSLLILALPTAPATSPAKLAPALSV